jgi:hypothetical protein
MANSSGQRNVQIVSKGEQTISVAKKAVMEQFRDTEVGCRWLEEVQVGDADRRGEGVSGQSTRARSTAKLKRLEATTQRREMSLARREGGMSTGDGDNGSEEAVQSKGAASSERMVRATRIHLDFGRSPQRSPQPAARIKPFQRSSTPALKMRVS